MRKLLTLVERSMRWLRLAAVVIIAGGAALYSPFLSGYVGPGTPTGDAIGTAASWLTANVASVWSGAMDALPAAVSPFAGSARAQSAPSAGAPMPLTPPVKPAAPASTPATAGPSPAKPATSASAAPATTGSTPAATRPAGSAPASVGAIPPASAPASSQAAAATQPPSLSPSELALVVFLTRNTLIAVNQANVTGNYTVLRDLGAPGFREANTASRLADIFAPLRTANMDLSSVVLLEPRLTTVKIAENGMLNIAGSLPMQPVPISFELLYQRVQNIWQVFGVSITADPAVAAAAKPAGTPAATPASSPSPTASPAIKGTVPTTTTRP
jgi:hypothetical protein